MDSALGKEHLQSDNSWAATQSLWAAKVSAESHFCQIALHFINNTHTTESYGMLLWDRMNPSCQKVLWYSNCDIKSHWSFGESWLKSHKPLPKRLELPEVGRSCLQNEIKMDPAWRVTAASPVLLCSVSSVAICMRASSTRALSSHVYQSSSSCRKFAPVASDTFLVASLQRRSINPGMFRRVTEGK